ncbi:hypothetical protein PABG_04963 [Paracoccidioides brasiliensis Pb03]|nr:hypothetical protein PABG_04963 [Paracoccidioides brasiliensis Pb03]
MGFGKHGSGNKDYDEYVHVFQGIITGNAVRRLRGKDGVEEEDDDEEEDEDEDNDMDMDMDMEENLQNTSFIILPHFALSREVDRTPYKASFVFGVRAIMNVSIRILKKRPSGLIVFYLG